jgi:hypothetical protein
MLPTTHMITVAITDLLTQKWRIQLVAQNGLGPLRFAVLR